jgi:hypothetical protein
MLQRGSLKTVLLLLRRGGVNRALACADGLNAVDYALQGGYKVSAVLFYTASTATGRCDQLVCLCTTMHRYSSIHFVHANLTQVFLVVLITSNCC